MKPSPWQPGTLAEPNSGFCRNEKPLVRKLFEKIEAPPCDHSRSRWKTMSRLLFDTPIMIWPCWPAAPNTAEASRTSPPSRLGSLLPTISSAPVKSLRVMMLTTPPIASEP